MIKRHGLVVHTTCEGCHARDVFVLNEALHQWRVLLRVYPGRFELAQAQGKPDDDGGIQATSVVTHGGGEVYLCSFSLDEVVCAGDSGAIIVAVRLPHENEKYAAGAIDQRPRTAVNEMSASGEEEEKVGLTSRSKRCTGNPSREVTRPSGVSSCRRSLPRSQLWPCTRWMLRVG